MRVDAQPYAARLRTLPNAARAPRLVPDGAGISSFLVRSCCIRLPVTMFRALPLASILLVAILLAAMPVLIPHPAAPLSLTARAQTVDTGDGAAAGQGARAELPEEAARDLRARELDDLRRDLERAAQAEREIAEEIATLQEDRAALAEALIEATTRIRDNEARSEDLTGRLESLIASEAAIRRSLEARRGVIMEVLAALQRMGRRPPPAVLVRPEDILSAVRTSMLLGAVVPELRAETEALAADLQELVDLRRMIAEDREALRTELSQLDRERRRLSGLIEARQERLRAAQQDFLEQGERAAELAARAGSLEELIAAMEEQIAAARAAAQAAQAADAALRAQTQARFAEAASLDPARLAPQIPFAQARGRLPRPVSGALLRRFDEPDDIGGRMQGVVISTRSGEIVTAPADGWIAFAGTYRSFERLLIINAGDDYYVMMSGMENITVDVGQFVLAGEPVATMGGVALVSPAMGLIDAEGPVLYVEFRKGGGSIDPSPWWQDRFQESRHDTPSEKVRG